MIAGVFFGAVLALTASADPPPPSGSPSPCVPYVADSRLDPDRKSSSGGLILESSLAVGEVMWHRGETTTRQANMGIVNYMRDSALASDVFRKQVLEFYTALQAKDRSDRRDNCRIDQSGFDVLPDAMKAAKGDPYLALKILAFYGHDNQNNEVDDAVKRGIQPNCGLQPLDQVRSTLEWSNLYCSGALGGVAYGQDWIDRGKKIADDCNRAFPNDEDAGFFCNDGYKTYKADYYHVIAGAFLACRRGIAEREANASAPATRLVSSAMDEIQGEAARYYKLERFEERMNRIPRPPEPLRTVLKAGLARLRRGARPVLPPQTELGMDWQTLRFGFKRVDDKTYAQARAILARFEFEADFRVYQHKLGINFGQKLCAQVSRRPVCGP